MNSPGQNTGVGSLSLLQGIFPTQGLNPGLPQCRRILFCLFVYFLIAPFRTLGWAPSCPGIALALAVDLSSTCREILHQLSHKGSPGILESVAYPFSSGSSRPRNPTGASCIAGGFFTNCATREPTQSPQSPLIQQASWRARGGEQMEALLCKRPSWVSAQESLVKLQLGGEGTPPSPL